jgi:hypothetical protein
MIPAYTTTAGTTTGHVIGRATSPAAPAAAVQPTSPTGSAAKW